MLPHSDGGPKPLQLKLDTLMSLMPELDPSKIDFGNVNALLAEAFVAEGLQHDGTPPPGLIQVIKMPTLNGHNNFTLTVAPQLFAPGELDPLTATVLLSQLQIKIDENAVKTGMLKIDADREAFEQSQEKTKKAMRDADAAEDRAAAAAKEAQAGNIASAVMAVIGALIGAFVAAVFGGFLLGGLALLGAFLALQEMISVGIKAVPDKDAKALTYENAQGANERYGATFQDFISMGSAKRAKDGNLVVASQNAEGKWVNQKGEIIADPRVKNPNAVIMSPKAFNDMSVGLAIGLTVVMTIMMLAGGIYAVRNPSDIVKVAERLSKLGVKVGDVGLTVAKAENIGTLVTSLHTIGNAAGDGAAAGLRLKTAQEQLVLAGANALKSYIQSMVDAQAKHMQTTQDFIHTLVELLQECLSVVAKAIGDTHQVQVQIAQNLVAPRS